MTVPSVVAWSKGHQVYDVDFVYVQESPDRDFAREIRHTKDRDTEWFAGSEVNLCVCFDQEEVDFRSYMYRIFRYLLIFWLRNL
jgi:hypothetical protein